MPRILELMKENRGVSTFHERTGRNGTGWKRVGWDGVGSVRMSDIWGAICFHRHIVSLFHLVLGPKCCFVVVLVFFIQHWDLNLGPHTC
jgi:hypothetical protein